MSSGPQRTKVPPPSTSAHDAFASVDSLVSKPVIGSDNTASWQSFQRGTDASSTSISGSIGRTIGTGSAPSLPVKRADRLGTGLKSREEEARHEDEVRKRAGDAPIGSGYTAFKRRVDQDELAAKKRRKLIADRVRPDDMRYFIASDTFDGWKEDYIFTTRDRGSGYYYDGMDSAKKQLGIEIGAATTPNSSGPDRIDGGPDALSADGTAKKRKEKHKKKKKRKSKAIAESPHVDDTNNPMDQIADAIRRRNESLLRPPGSILGGAGSAAGADAIGLTGSGLGVVGAVEPSSTDRTQQLAAKGWEQTPDPSTGKHYYFNRSTGERTWNNPLLEQSSAEDTADDTCTGARDQLSTRTTLPDGWAEAQDASSGKTYYYHSSSGKTQWTKPTSMEPCK
mmetsp:Transcript_25608/g.56034  ORF Transcript_25608/g.56034 Transcript_25608/m.56034 type:complete len:395 (-) Transcript_25608:39-1223(-)